jgi:hypothetical protein
MGRIKNIGQSIIEFTFAMIAIAFLVYGLIAIFRWVGLDLAERRFEHENLLTNTELTTEQQLSPEFYRVRHLDAVYTRNIVK